MVLPKKDCLIKTVFLGLEFKFMFLRRLSVSCTQIAVLYRHEPSHGSVYQRNTVTRK